MDIFSFSSPSRRMCRSGCWRRSPALALLILAFSRLSPRPRRLGAADRVRHRAAGAGQSLDRA